MERPLNIPEHPINLEGIQIYLLEDGSTIDEVHEQGITIGREGSEVLNLLSRLKSQEAYWMMPPIQGKRSKNNKQGKKIEVLGNVE